MATAQFTSMVAAGGTAASTAAQSKPKEWQRWTTVGGSVTATKIYQDSSLWLDLSNTVAVRITAHISYVGGSAEITLQTSNSPDGPWTDVTSGDLDAVGKTVLAVSSESDNEPYPGRRYLRWMASGGAANWEICFRLMYEVM